MTVDPGSLRRNVGICGMEIQLPSLYVSQEDIEDAFSIPKGKVTIGLGCQEMSICLPSEDVVSLSLSAVHKLMEKYRVRAEDVGRVEVGSESNFDNSKPIKSFLMDLFKGNCRVMGADSVSACYGGTAALLNTVAWMESSMYDGTFAIVVCSDVAIYKEGPSLPTGGGGAVALLLGCNAPITIDGRMGHCFRNVYDFWKPKETAPYPMVDGKTSLECYLSSFTECYRQMEGVAFDYLCCHSPFPKLPLKAARSIPVADALVEPSLTISRRNGNSYTASLYMCLLSLLNSGMPNNSTVLMFSYGSGLSSSMFTLRVRNTEPFLTDIPSLLGSRRRVKGSEYLSAVSQYVAHAPIAEGGSGYLLSGIADTKRTYRRHEN